VNPHTNPQKKRKKKKIKNKKKKLFVSFFDMLQKPRAAEKFEFPHV
jgi:hypothetical protein